MVSYIILFNLILYILLRELGGIMNKLLILIISLAILITLGFIFFSTPTINNKITTPKISIKTSKAKAIEKETTSIQTQVKTEEINKSSNKLSDEIKLLLDKADNLLEESKDDEALKIYDLIIEKIANSSDPKLLKYFASAYMSKGYIYQIYPNIDNDAAIEAFSMIINKFEKSNNSELLQLFIDAKIQLSYLLPNDEKLEIYNELLSKFENNLDVNIQKRVESLLITKSFQLMGKNDEEAMQILDKVIERYQEKDANINLPENVRFSILNNIELALITNNDSDTYVELAKKFMSDSPDTKPLLDMLDILKNSQDLNQDDALEVWKNEYADYRFPDWSFQEVERWAEKIEDQETKDRVSKYINAFINQKYNIPDKYSDSVTYQETPTNNATQIYDAPYSNQENEIYTPIENNDEEEIVEDEMTEEEIYENDINQEDENISKEPEMYPDPYENSDVIPYEPDPYAQEIYDATGEYPNPYE